MKKEDINWGNSGEGKPRVDNVNKRCKHNQQNTGYLRENLTCKWHNRRNLYISQRKYSIKKIPDTKHPKNLRQYERTKPTNSSTRGRRIILAQRPRKYFQEHYRRKTSKDGDAYKGTEAYRTTAILDH